MIVHVFNSIRIKFKLKNIEGVLGGSLRGQEVKATLTWQRLLADGLKQLPLAAVTPYYPD